jgi:hypothetical protein
MNDIDLKLREKLNFFSEIDKSLGSANNVNKIVKKTPASIDLPRSNPNNKSQIQKAPINENTALKEEANCNKLYNFKVNKFEHNRANSKEYNILSTKENTEEKTLSKMPNSPELPVGDRLYNHGFYVKEKIEKKRQQSESDLIRNMTPDITRKARIINRDPNKFPERLYPAKDSETLNNSIMNTPNFNDSFGYNVYRKEIPKKPINYSFKPIIDYKSRKIASKLLPSKERLLQKKKRSKSFDLDNSLLSNISGKSRKSDPERIEKLYKKGLQQMKSRDESYKKKKEKENEAYKQYSYRPKIRESSKTNTSTPKKEFYEKAYNWRKSVDNRINKMKNNQESNKTKELTFKPNIKKQVIPTDEKFIMKRIDQIEDYVTKRRKVLAKKKEDEEYKRKIFSYGENYKAKPTLQKPFQFRTSSRSKSRSVSPDINKMRKELRTINYFDHDKNELVINTSNDIYFDDNKQNEFMKAVSNLQEKLSSLKL